LTFDARDFLLESGDPNGQFPQKDNPEVYTFACGTVDFIHLAPSSLFSGGPRYPGVGGTLSGFFFVEILVKHWKIDSASYSMIFSCFQLRVLDSVPLQ
jgi:hypothetical protein